MFTLAAHCNDFRRFDICRQMNVVPLHLLQAFALDRLPARQSRAVKKSSQRFNLVQGEIDVDAMTLVCANSIIGEREALLWIVFDNLDDIGAGNVVFRRQRFFELVERHPTLAIKRQARGIRRMTQNIAHKFRDFRLQLCFHHDAKTSKSARRRVCDHQSIAIA
ncbi:hypothetical protein GGE15_000091 [Rhizobium esperanzae]|uniref:Uncharacterized protein n=1 Tax=Rhizobium esperanzae TaxID=1967781 RepID=A0A7W6UEV9_9HYPH|nr:hypothetical protein [Rhizobium esperanzae]